jgi:hypothetical protein
MKKIFFPILVMLLLVGCGTTSPNSVTPTASKIHIVPAPTDPLPGATSQPAVTTTSATPAPTAASALTSTPTMILTPTASPISEIHPMIHASSGPAYDLVFSIPVSAAGQIQYQYGPDGIFGPQTFAIFSDGSVLMDAPLRKQLIHFDSSGKYLNSIDLRKAGIYFAHDLQIRNDEILILETQTYVTPKKAWVHHLSLDGKLRSSDDIPIEIPLDLSYTNSSGVPIWLEVVLSGLAVDCDNSPILVVEGGARLYPLDRIQKVTDLSQVEQGFHCRQQRYQPEKNPLSILAGKMLCETRKTVAADGTASLRLLDVRNDGGFYTLRSDMMDPMGPRPGSKWDNTVHFTSWDGQVQAVAHPPRETAYGVAANNVRYLTVGPDGEVYAMIPREKSIDIVRLNFYASLEPLAAGAAAPVVTCTNTP